MHKTYSLGDQTDLIDRLHKAQNGMTEVDILTFGAICKSRKTLMNDVLSCEARVKEKGTLLARLLGEHLSTRS